MNLGIRSMAPGDDDRERKNVRGGLNEPGEER